jgi:FAD/FMN-containing dehydrogenase
MTRRERSDSDDPAYPSWQRLRGDHRGLFDAFSCGPLCNRRVALSDDAARHCAAKTVAEAERLGAIARRGGACSVAASQCGQTVNASLVVDCSRYLDRILEIDVAGRRCAVEPGIVLDDLNRALKPHGLWFPVDISTASRATIGGMAANNSCGARSLRYGTMRDNVLSIDAVLANSSIAHFGPITSDLSDVPASLCDLVKDLLALSAREADEVKARFPKVQRRVGGYNLDSLLSEAPNLSHLLVGSEGTLAFSTRIELKLWPLLGRRVVGACHFGSFYQAMEAAQHIVKLGPIAVELIDRTMLELARDIAMFCPTLEKFVRGEPDAILLVEFGEDDFPENERRLSRLRELIGDLGFSWDKNGARFGGVVDVLDPSLQTAIADLRTAGLNVMMSMKEAASRCPSSRIARCRSSIWPNTPIVSRSSSSATAPAAPGMRTRPSAACTCALCSICGLRRTKAMRAIAEEAFAFVRAYKGSHSGEHGDGIVRSEFHEPMFELVWCAHSRRSRTASIRVACSIRAESCARRSSMTEHCSAMGRVTAARNDRRRSIGRAGRVRAAGCWVLWRCATIMALAANRSAASCARASALRARSAT